MLIFFSSYINSRNYIIGNLNSWQTICQLFMSQIHNSLSSTFRQDKQRRRIRKRYSQMIQMKQENKSVNQQMGQENKPGNIHPRVYKKSPYLYTSFQSEFQKQDKSVRAVLIGQCGTGKTNFINNISNKNHLTGISPNSVTKQIAYQDVLYIKNSKFRIYDTQGNNSLQFKYDHAVILKDVLTTLPLNLIIIQNNISYGPFQSKIQQINQKLKIFKGYQQMIVLAFSHLDKLCQKQSQILQKLTYFQQFLNQKTVLKKVIYYSNNEKTKSDFEKLSKILYALAKKNKSRKLQINDNIFYKYFNVSSSINQISGYHRRQIKRLFKKGQLYKDFVKNIQKSEHNLLKILSQFKIYSKKQLELKIQDPAYQQISDNKRFDLSIIFSKIRKQILQQIDKLADQKVEVTQNQYDKFFIQCQNCGQVWNIQGNCNTQTYCGNRPQNNDQIQQIYSYRFQSKEDKITYQTIKSSGKNIQKYPQNWKKYGCNKIISRKNSKITQQVRQNIKNMNKISNYEQINLQLNQLKKNQVCQKYIENVESQRKKSSQIMKKDSFDSSRCEIF